MYNTLESLEFNEIIAKEKLIQEKQEELTSLSNNANNSMQIDFEEQLGKIGDVTRNLVNRGAKKLIKIATFVKDKTDKK